MKPIVSVIMPTYNCNEFILESIKSVQNQSYLNWELIIIDDCSTDNTQENVKKITESDHRIRLITNEINLGVSESRLIGVNNSRGNWIAFLDSDDLWEFEKLEKQMKFIEINNVDFVYTGSSFINRKSEVYKGVLYVPNRLTYKVLLKQNVISCSSVVIKKHLLSGIIIENDNLHEDYLTWLILLKKGIIAYGINEPLIKYRLSYKSKSGNKIKSSLMTYRVYRKIGLNIFVASYYMIGYFFAKIMKYSKIKLRKRQ